MHKLFNVYQLKNSIHTRCTVIRQQTKIKSIGRKVIYVAKENPYSMYDFYVIARRNLWCIAYKVQYL